MVLLDKSQNKILANVPVRTTYSVPHDKKGWLTVKWSPNGTMLAIHDSLSKHSKVLIYRRLDSGMFQMVKLPDMLKLEAGGRLGLDIDDIVSSGQEPSEWSKNKLLLVNYRFRTKNGQLYRRTLPLHVGDEGVYKPQQVEPQR